MAERAEEWQAGVGGHGGVLRVRHSLLQGRPGATLEAEKHALRHDAVRERLGLEGLGPSR